MAAGSEGLGLELLLAKGIIELHDGTITVNSARCDRGTEFIIELLLANIEALEAIETKEGDCSKKFGLNKNLY